MRKQKNDIDIKMSGGLNSTPFNYFSRTTVFSYKLISTG